MRLRVLLTSLLVVSVLAATYWGRMLQNGQAAGLFALLVQNPSSGFTPSGPEIGSFAPDFDLVDLKGTHVRLSDFRGKPVVVALGSYT